MSELQLYLLGPPRIELNGAPVELSLRKAIALLAYLGVKDAGADHRRDALAALLWPDYDQGRALASLRSTLWAINKTAIGVWLKVDQEKVRLSSDRDVWLDVARFRQLLAERELHSHPADEVCPACLPLLTEAATLFRDDFLAGFTLRDSHPFDEWQFFEGESLRQELAFVLERLIETHDIQGTFEAALPSPGAG